MFRNSPPSPLPCHFTGNLNLGSSQIWLSSLFAFLPSYSIVFRVALGEERWKHSRTAAGGSASFTDVTFAAFSHKVFQRQSHAHSAAYAECGHTAPGVSLEHLVQQANGY